MYQIKTINRLIQTIKHKIIYVLISILFSFNIHTQELSITSNIPSNNLYKVYIIYNNKYQINNLKHLLYYFLKSHNYNLLIQYSIFNTYKLNEQSNQIKYMSSNIINHIHTFNPDLIICIGNSATNNIILKNNLYSQFPILTIYNSIDIDYLLKKNSIPKPKNNLFVVQSIYQLKPLIYIFFVSDTAISTFYFLYNNSTFSTYYITKFNQEISNLHSMLPTLNFKNIYIENTFQLKMKLANIPNNHSIIVSLLPYIYNLDTNKNINTIDIYKIIFDFKQQNFLLSLDDLPIKNNIFTFGLLNNTSNAELTAFQLFKNYIFTNQLDSQIITLHPLLTINIQNVLQNIFLKNVLHNKLLFDVISP